MIYGQNPSKESRPVQTDADGRILAVLTDTSGTSVGGTKITAATIPAGGVGLLGWISAVWYQLTVQLPASLGIKTAAASLSVAPASDAKWMGSATTVTTSFNRPSDTTAYAANDSISDSTSTPTSGGFTLTDAARVSGGSGLIIGMVVVSTNDPATTLQGEVWLYDSAATADNDNAAFTSSDSDTLKLVGIVPFTLASTAGGSGTTSQACVTGLNIPFTCVGSANLRYKIKAKNAYTPASAETISVRAQIVHTS